MPPLEPFLNQLKYSYMILWKQNLILSSHPLVCLLYFSWHIFKYFMLIKWCYISNPSQDHPDKEIYRCINHSNSSMCNFLNIQLPSPRNKYIINKFLLINPSKQLPNLAILHILNENEISTNLWTKLCVLCYNAKNENCVQMSIPSVQHIIQCTRSYFVQRKLWVTAV